MDQYTTYIEVAKKWFLANSPSMLAAIAIFILGRWLTKWVCFLIRKALTKSGMDVTLVRFLDKLIYYTLLVAVILAAADQMGIKTTSFLAILGAAGLAIGLALKDSLSNFASGVMLILFQPFRVGNAITAAGVTGTVERIDIFSSVLLTPDNQKIIIPNSSITSDVIINITANPTRRIDLVIGISYDDDIREAKTILENIIKADSRILTDPAPTIVLGEFGASSIDLFVRPWTKTEEYWSVRCDLMESIKLTFDEKGISFPFPQQDVHMFQHTAE
jgi:small conductance mechanosensitive channel